MKCCSGLMPRNLSVFAFGYLRQLVAQLFVLFVLLILAFFVDAEIAVELRNRTGRTENVLGVGALRGNVDGGLIEDRGRHLRSDEAHPDEPVQFDLVVGEVALDFVGGAQYG